MRSALIARHRLIFTLLLICALAFVWPATRARADHQFLWWDDIGTTFTTFGANATIEINTGQIEYLTACPSDGVPDFVYPAADIYIVPAGSVSLGSELSDVAEEPNTVVAATSGLFEHEVIGYALPTGVIGEGTYAATPYITTVRVPQSSGGTAIDGGALYDSTVP